MANVEVGIRANSNVPAVLSEDEAALRKAAVAHEKAQKEIQKVIAKGDPLKQMEIQKERELKVIERAAAKSKALTEEAEKARAAVVERYAKKRVEFEEEAAKKIADAAIKQAQEASKAQEAAAKAAEAAKFKITDVGKPLKNVSGLIAKLGGDAGSAMGSVGKLGTSLISTFAVGGPLALGVAAVGTGIAAFISYIRESAQAAEEAREKQREAWNSTIAKIEEATAALREQARVKQLLLGLDTPTAQNARLAEDAYQSAKAIAARIKAEKEALEAARALRPSTDSRVSRFQVAAARETIDRDGSRDFDKEIADAEAVEQRAFVARAEAAKLRDEQAERDRIEREGAPFAGINLSGKSGGGAGAGRSRAAVSRSDTAAADRMIAEFQRDAKAAARMRDVAEQELADVLAANDPILQLDLRTKRALAGIESRIEEAKRIAESGDAEARQNAIVAQQALEDQKSAVTKNAAFERIRLEADALRRGDPGKREAASPPDDEATTAQWVTAGANAASQFSSGFKQYMESGDAKDLIRGALQVAGIVADFMGAGGAGSASANLIGGLFEQGGVPYAYHLPQGRSGLAVMPGVNNDAKPAWLHQQEVVIPSDVIAEDLGGMPEAMALAAGRGLRRGGGGGGGTVIQIHAWDSVDTLGALARMEGAVVQRAEARQGGRALAAASPQRWS